MAFLAADTVTNMTSIMLNTFPYYVPSLPNVLLSGYKSI